MPWFTFELPLGIFIFIVAAWLRGMWLLYSIRNNVRKVRAMTKPYHLTSQQLDEIADELLGTDRNPYQFIWHGYKVRVNEDILNDLRKHGDVFRCKDCGIWHPTEMEAKADDSFSPEICPCCHQKNSEKHA